ncbi:hypothetical protein Afil01_46340 [Actinorhabdospora filicis]|uniref:Uncharacterized protein n=1 Tax=Actinorhabdospora filicis TaxID=1785913 RepID=A0A9W6SPN8_9ACTN|nr:hypothetical protein [Actinorhabdospora filicis]GLZ79827.1 hypothetical protein Afil01_46340 [Actinorhabdospora filicis]
MKLIDRVVTRLVGKAVAKASPCQGSQYTYCVPSGICAGGHSRYKHVIKPDCTESDTWIGCC